MNKEFQKDYRHIHAGGAGFFETRRGLIAVSGGEAVQFLDGLITNDVKTLADGGQMLAAFPNAQGRLLAVIRVQRRGDQFLIETEEATREAVFQNLFRFTYAGDFFVEDLSDNYRYFEIFGPGSLGSGGGLTFEGRSTGYFVPHDKPMPEGPIQISDELYETLRIESGVPKFGVDMDESTIVPELGIDGLISYNKGCYIGQEIIARIHFRGHVAKQLTGLVSDGTIEPGDALKSPEGKPAGRITSVTYSPKLERAIALAYVRNEFLQKGTVLVTGNASVEVTDLPFDV
ncbi:MAG: folate-binding protein YgfZ [Acidobacteria bacterium]|nr:folate-binding protein YgfZ [Acidobacteriota bacterium]MCW5948868.1 folate-binding protein YgfZ [Pyrinomonadaceae bacterium]